ncbi:hypothetical protein [Streptomyces sp. NPDC003480]
MHDFIERIGGWTPVAIFGGAVIIGAGILGVHAATSDSGSSGGLDNTSAEYQDGWDQSVSSKVYEKYDLSMAINDCLLPIKYKNVTNPDDVMAGYFFPHWDTYNDHQRREWAHGCLDALRNLTDYKVPQQSWEG